MIRRAIRETLAQLVRWGKPLGHDIKDVIVFKTAGTARAGLTAAILAYEALVEKVSHVEAR
ncbi:hypothetical protein [Bartonella sp. DGB2]|uniref:hypothetical protein n=1 Tax=Bartonella sp. DGB2 TaxID=3388426 RepID=UPI00398FFB7E